MTGEHGVGIEKINSMCVQFSPEERDAFHAVKRAFDPPGLLNPDKGIPDPRALRRIRQDARARRLAAASRDCRGFNAVLPADASRIARVGAGFPCSHPEYPMRVRSWLPASPRPVQSNDSTTKQDTMEEDDIVAVLVGTCAFAASAEERACASVAAAPRTGTVRRCEGDILDTRAYRGIIAYDPAELVITARAGTPLRRSRPRSPNATRCCRSSRRTSGRDATIGGCIAAGIAGPRRAVGRRAARLRARRRRHERPGPGAAFRRPGGEERRRLRRLAPDGRLARHAGADPRTVDQGAADGRRPKPRSSST